jgi:hypothetical protein
MDFEALACVRTRSSKCEAPANIGHAIRQIALGH